MICRSCKVEHSPLISCSRARLLAETAARKALPVVVLRPDPVETVRARVETSKPVETAGGRHGMHRDPEAHRILMCEHMRRKRAAAKSPK
jgi:hypothetical protein